MLADEVFQRRRVFTQQEFNCLITVQTLRGRYRPAYDNRVARRVVLVSVLENWNKRNVLLKGKEGRSGERGRGLPKKTDENGYHKTLAYRERCCRIY